jgi:hypothetical protein
MKEEDDGEESSSAFFGRSAEGTTPKWGDANAKWQMFPSTFLVLNCSLPNKKKTTEICGVQNRMEKIGCFGAECHRP